MPPAQRVTASRHDRRRKGLGEQGELPAPPPNLPRLIALKRSAAMRKVIVLAVVGAFGIGPALLTSALALDEPVAWRDPDSGCAYWLTRQGGIAPRFRPNGTPDCPEGGLAARTPSSPLVSDQAVQEAVRELGRGLDAVRREVERLSDRMRR